MNDNTPKRIRTLAELDGLSIKDAARIPHPVDLGKWTGRYWIDVDLGVFRVKDEWRRATSEHQS
jgi:hypothetical protein